MARPKRYVIISSWRPSPLWRRRRLKAETLDRGVVRRAQADRFRV